MLQLTLTPCSEPRASLRRTVAGLLKQMPALLVASTLTLPAHSLTARPNDPAGSATSASFIDSTERERRLTQSLAAIGDLRESLNRAEFDTEALLESLDYDPEAVIDFVRDEIRFEPYEGLLRGVQGTLMGRAGNALDQALLLTVLLQETGADARLAHGLLDEEQALQLVRSLRGQTTPAPVSNLSGIRPHLERIALAATANNVVAGEMMQVIDEGRQSQELSTRAAADTGRDYLQEHLSKVGISLEPTDAEPQLAAQSMSYFWVEYKDGSAAPWQRIHVIPVADAFDAQVLAVREYLTENIPERFQHRLRLTAKLERQVSGKTEVVELMQPWERPVANLTGKRLTFSNQPNGLKSLQDLGNLGQIEARTTLLIPTLNDAPAPGAQAFDLIGRTIAFSTLQMGGDSGAALFQTLGDQSLAAANALAGLSIGKPKPEAATTAYQLRRVWLEYTSIHPDGSERVDERTIWQAPAAMSQAPSSIMWELATPHGIGVAASEYPDSYLLDMELARLQSLEPLLRWAMTAQNEATPDELLPPPPDLDRASWGFPELSYLSQFDAGINTDADALLAYRAEPALLVTRQGLRNTREQATGYADVDIIHNRRTTLRTDAAPIRTDPLEAMRLGAWDTLIEQVELESRLPLLFAGGPATVISANRMYQEPQRSSQAPLALLRPADLATLPAASLDEATRLALEQDLQRGYVVMMETPAHPQPLVWWRVNPHTGETLGRGLDGRGQITAEHVALIISAKTSIIAGTAICYASANSCSLARCVATAAFTTALGGGGGFAAAYYFGAAAGAIVGVGLGVGFHPVMNALPGGGIPSCFLDG